jgi:hypothetical protein
MADSVPPGTEDPEPGQPEALSEVDPPGSGSFEFDLAGPFFAQVFTRLQQVQAVPLDIPHVGAIREEPGVYILYMGEQPVYVGKADDSIKVRLTKHLRTLGGCQNINLAEMWFKCLYVAATWSPLNYEEAVMEKLGTKRMPGWNNKGFGSNEPGVIRGKTRFKEGHFYRRFPIRKDWRCTGIPSGRRPAFKVLQEIKENVPFWFKFPGYRIPRVGAEDGEVESQEQARRELQETSIDVPDNDMLARDLLLLVARNLPGTWQATLMGSHMLLYKEENAVYPMMEVIWPLAPAPH